MIKLLQSIKILITVAQDMSTDWSQQNYKPIADEILALESQITGKPIPNYVANETILIALLIIASAGIDCAKDYESKNFVQLAKDIIALAEKLAALQKQGGA